MWMLPSKVMPYLLRLAAPLMDSSIVHCTGILFYPTTVWPIKVSKGRYQIGALQSKAMKSSPLLGPFCGSEFWGFSLLKI